MSKRVSTRLPISSGLTAVSTAATVWRRPSRPIARARKTTPTTVAQRHSSISTENAAPYGPGSTPANQKSPAARGGYSRLKSA